MSRVNDLALEIRNRRRDLDRQQGEARAIAMRGKALQEEIAQLKKDAAVYEQVSALLNSIGETRQHEAQEKIESLVTLGLKTIFEPNLSFHIIQKEGVKNAQVEFIIRSTLAEDRVVDTGVLDARGGGLAATVGFLLRVVVLLLSKPKTDPILVLDEVFAHVSADYLDRVSDFLREITDKTGVQILMVTHQSELTEAADKVYRFSLDDSGYTKVESVG